MRTDTFDIQGLVQESGVPRRTIHFYVQQGILPPPEGAGLAAHYSENHLLRLQMIPILRRQGLRLDEIRARLAAMAVEDLRRVVADAARQAEPPTSQPPALQEIRASRSVYQTGQPFTHYNLPDGVIIVTPGNLSPEGNDRLSRLLEAAARIYLNQPRPVPDHGNIKPDSKTTQED